jgi:hypothetical protein
MEPTEQPTTPLPEQSTPIAQPIQLSPEEARKQQINAAFQTSSSVITMIISGISRVVREVSSMILKR